MKSRRALILEEKIVRLKVWKRRADEGLRTLDRHIEDLEEFIQEGGRPDLGMRLDVVQSFENTAGIMRTMMNQRNDFDTEYMKQSAIRLVRLSRVTERYAVFGETVH